MTNCAHHWIISEANGPTSQGVCQQCGAAKEFVNSFRYGQSYNNQQWGDLTPFVINKVVDALEGDIFRATEITYDNTRKWQW